MHIIPFANIMTRGIEGKVWKGGEGRKGLASDILIFQWKGWRSIGRTSMHVRTANCLLCENKVYVAGLINFELRISPQPQVCFFSYTVVYEPVASYSQGSRQNFPVHVSLLKQIYKELTKTLIKEEEK